MNLRSCCGEDSPAVRIVSKENVIVHDALGDAITLWVKRGDWYLIFYPGPYGRQADYRLPGLHPAL